MKTAELVGPALDWAVAKCEGVPERELFISWSGLFRRNIDEYGDLNGRYTTGPDLLFSRKWEAGGPIIEREEIDLECDEFYSDDRKWQAITVMEGVAYEQLGPTPLIAAMRCYCASKLGDEVEIPEGL